MTRVAYKHQTGFTLIEILVSTVILAIGLLGLASMQTLALKDNRDAFFFAQASSLTYEMSDRIRANRTGWLGAIPTPATSCTATSNCNTTTGCTSDEMASFDYCAWSRNVKDRITAATPTVATSPVAGSTVCTDGSGVARCISISWGRSNTKLGANNKFELEMFP